MLTENRIDSATLTSIYDLVSRNYIKANSATLMNREILDLSDRKLSDESASTLSDLLKTLATPPKSASSSSAATPSAT